MHELLTLDELWQLAGLASALGLEQPSRRAILWAEIGDAHLAHVPLADTAVHQLFNDLSHLCRLDDPRPLVRWLEIARRLAAGRPEARQLRVFEERLAEQVRAGEGLPSRILAEEAAEAANRRLVETVDSGAASEHIEAAIAAAERAAEALGEPSLRSGAYARIAWAYGMLGDRRSARRAVELGMPGGEGDADVLRRLLDWLGGEPGRETRP